MNKHELLFMLQTVKESKSLRSVGHTTINRANPTHIPCKNPFSTAKEQQQQQ